MNPPFPPPADDVSYRWAIRLILQTCLAVFLVATTGNPLEAENKESSCPSLPAFGARCKEESGCLLMGDTHILVWHSPNPSKIVLVCIHGLGLCAKAYAPLAKELAAAGVDGYGVNVRGFGPDRERPERAELNCIDTVDDIRELLVCIHKDRPGYKVFLVGESMGGALAVRVAAENPELVDGVVCSAPAWKLLKMRQTAVKGVFELFFFHGTKPGPAGRALMQQASSDQELRQHWLDDSAHRLKLSLKEAKAFMSFISKTDKFAKRLKKPVLIIQGLNDRLVSPESVARIYRDIPVENKTFLIDGEGEHLLLEEGQFSQKLKDWLLNWLNAVPNQDSLRPKIEVVNDEVLSAQEIKHLSELKHRAE